MSVKEIIKPFLSKSIVTKEEIAYLQYEILRRKNESRHN